MIKGKCTNPSCHRDYDNLNYAEVVTLRRLNDGALNYFVISVCEKCLASANDIIIASALRDAVNYEIQSNTESIMLTKEQKLEFRKKEERYTFLGWGRNREELDAKVLKE